MSINQSQVNMSMADPTGEEEPKSNLMRKMLKIDQLNEA
jgi:hypothetical protein